MISDQDLLFFEKHHITYRSHLNVMYNDIDLEKVRIKCVNHLGSPDCVILNIEYDKIYQVRVFKNHFIILNISNNYRKLIKIILNYCGIKGYNTIDMTNMIAKTTFKNKFIKSMIPNMYYFENKKTLRLPHNRCDCHIYKTHYVLSATDPKYIIEMYKLLYSRIDLPIILKLIFNHPNSLFYTLPLELYDVILSLM